ncbi:DUF3888 domain-containing protein [Bacillus sp. RG28]|uniref:DUF3888 domain-containing protein n=1 Tax=Gottfriedia endophytica TaxID=2820819 RepID=A0A940NE66_9BACI|nr:DUF3888 domain-containing protein [Gottfriedia endophytica]MBP0723849.1 DUF3888 domain-containing protein [Gottfriedia endophytica]
MRKYFFIFILSVFFISLSPDNPQAKENKLSEEQLIRSALVITLLPHIKEKISEYLKDFKTYGTYGMSFGAMDTEILSIKNQNPNEPFTYETEIEISTFEHAHNPPYFKITITLDFQYSEYKITNFKIEGDDTFKEIEAFYNETLSDIQQSFNLQLTDYTHYNPNELKDLEYIQLNQIVTNIEKTILAPDARKTHPFKNVVAPITFLKGSKGYILFKKGDGTNVVYIIEKENGIWAVIDKKQKKGKKMETKLLWYY